jgi:hypothetical protein
MQSWLFIICLIVFMYNNINSLSGRNMKTFEVGIMLYYLRFVRIIIITLGSHRVIMEAYCVFLIFLRNCFCFSWNIVWCVDNSCEKKIRQEKNVRIHVRMYACMLEINFSFRIMNCEEGFKWWSRSWHKSWRRIQTLLSFVFSIKLKFFA